MDEVFVQAAGVTVVVCEMLGQWQEAAHELVAHGGIAGAAVALQQAAVFGDTTW